MWFARAIARNSKTSNWRSHALIGCVLLLALLLAGASWFATNSAAERERAEASRTRAIEVLQVADGIKIAALSAMRGERGYLLTGDKSFLRPLEEAIPRGRALTARLRILVSDNSGQISHADSVEAEFNSYIAQIEGIVELGDEGNQAEAIGRVRDGEGRRALELMASHLDQVTLRETAALEERSLIARELARKNQNYQYLLTSVGLALMVLSGITALAVRRALIAEAATSKELRRRATTDELTGLTNRREFLASLDRAISAAERNDRPLALAVLDIDHFKRVNDTYGHPAGDSVIRTVARTAKEAMRVQDTVGRLGGEEFAIVLPDCTAYDAISACERLRVAVREAGLEIVAGDTISVTLSTGIAILKNHDDAEKMIARADTALYDAKNRGRDQVLLAA